jgi:hypothetical protein
MTKRKMKEKKQEIEEKSKKKEGEKMLKIQRKMFTFFLTYTWFENFQTTIATAMMTTLHP